MKDPNILRTVNAHSRLVTSHSPSPSYNLSIPTPTVNSPHPPHPIIYLPQHLSPPPTVTSPPHLPILSPDTLLEQYSYLMTTQKSSGALSQLPPRKAVIGCDYLIKCTPSQKCFIIESVDSINRDDRGFPLTQYITNGGISRSRNTITHFKHHHRALWRISNRMSV